MKAVTGGLIQRSDAAAMMLGRDTSHDQPHDCP